MLFIPFVFNTNVMGWMILVISPYVFSLKRFCAPTSKDRRKLLRQWVESGQNPASIEADICLLKSRGTTLTCDRELLSVAVAEMTKRGIPPPQKIEAVVSKGNGVPDPDLPGDVSLMKFWVSTATKKVEKEEINMEQRMKIRAAASGAAVDGFFDGMGPVGSGSMGSTNVSEIIDAVNKAGRAGGEHSFLAIVTLKQIFSNNFS